VLPEMLACLVPRLVTKCWEWLASKQILQNASGYHVIIYILDFYHTVVPAFPFGVSCNCLKAHCLICLSLKYFYLFAKISENTPKQALQYLILRFNIQLI
jgi:hypothetical protein